MAAWWEIFTWPAQLVESTIAKPIQSMLDNIAGGIETGIVSVIGDLWKVVLPFLEIVAGLIIIIIALMIGLGGMSGPSSLAGAGKMAALIAVK